MDHYTIILVAAECFAEVMFRAKKGLGLDLEDETALLKFPLKMKRRRGGTRENLYLINSAMMSSHGLVWPCHSHLVFPNGHNHHVFVSFGSH